MTASVVEVVSGDVPISSAGTGFTITTTLTSSDVVVVVASRAAAGTHTISGLGATWTDYLYLSDGTAGDMQVHYTTGVTGSGTVTLDNPNASFTRGVSVYVVRGLNSFAITEQHSVWDNNNTTAGTDELTPSQSFGQDQVAIIAGMVSAGTVTFPSGSTPASGWTNDQSKSTTYRAYTAHLVGTSAHSTLVAGFRSSSSRPIGVLAIVLGTPTVTSGLTSTFIGWGLDAGI